MGKRNNLSRLVIHKKLKRSLITTNLKNPFAKSQEKSTKHKSKDNTIHTYRYTYRERFFKFLQTTSTQYLMEEKTSAKCASKRLNHTKFSIIKPQISTFYYK
jgi:hypothetical protein